MLLASVPWCKWSFMIGRVVFHDTDGGVCYRIVLPSTGGISCCRLGYRYLVCRTEYQVSGYRHML